MFVSIQGALIGCLSGAVFTFWVGIGHLTIHQPSVALEPVPTDQCPDMALDTNFTISHTTDYSSTIDSDDVNIPVDTDM